MVATTFAVIHTLFIQATNDDGLAKSDVTRCRRTPVHVVCKTDSLDHFSYFTVGSLFSVLMLLRYRSDQYPTLTKNAWKLDKYERELTGTWHGAWCYRAGPLDETSVRDEPNERQGKASYDCAKVTPPGAYKPPAGPSGTCSRLLATLLQGNCSSGLHCDEYSTVTFKLFIAGADN